MIQSKEQFVDTIHGRLYTTLSSVHHDSELPAVVFLHGNSSDSKIFSPLLDDTRLKDHYTLITIDLPGHGRSGDSPNPEQSYHQRAYATAVLEVVKYYQLASFVVLGWSLGGHVAIELLPLLSGPENRSAALMAGLMVVGTPPCYDRSQIARAFNGDVASSVAAKAQLSQSEAEGFADALTGLPAPSWLVASVARTDGRSREIMFRSFLEGRGSDQIELIHAYKEGLIGVVNGAAEPYVNLDYCDEVCRGAQALWRGRCIRLPGLEHAPFFEDREVFLPIFVDFLKDCISKQRRSAV